MEGHQVFSIFNTEDFIKVTRRLKLAACMKYGSQHLQDGQKLCTEGVPDTIQGLGDLSVSHTLFCSFCNISFVDSKHQRSHYKEPLHCFNLKQKLCGEKYVTQEVFEQMSDSETGFEFRNESTEDDTSGPSSSDIAQMKSEGELFPEPDKGAVRKDNARCIQVARLPKVFFENSESQILSFYRCVLHGKKDVPEIDDKLVDLALNSAPKSMWAIIMLGGGHFAAGIFNGNEPVVHKTFHSYTTRARQGGSQSSRDSRTGHHHPKSAGASLRRYNEASHLQHIQDMLAQWKSHLETCHLILYRATGQNRNILFGGRSPPFVRTDARLRSIPFSTRRANFIEVKRVHELLSSIEVYGAAEAYTTEFPQSPRKKVLNITETLNSGEGGTSECSTRCINSDLAAFCMEGYASSMTPESLKDCATASLVSENVETSLKSDLLKSEDNVPRSSNENEECSQALCKTIENQPDLGNSDRTVAAENLIDRIESIIINSHEEQTSSPATQERSQGPKRSKSKGIIDRAKPRKSPQRLLPEFVMRLARSSSDNDSSSEFGDFSSRIVYESVEISTAKNLKLFEDTVPYCVKNRKKHNAKKKKSRKDQEFVETADFSENVAHLIKSLLLASRTNSVDLLKSCITSVQNDEAGCVVHEGGLCNVTSEELIYSLNISVDSSDNRLLHVAAKRGNLDIVRILLDSGADPSLRNRTYETPYVVSLNKETKHVFRKFMADFPHKYDYSKSQIPAPLSEEIEKERAERKRVQKKAKREREKERRKEAEERENYLKLSDYEKKTTLTERKVEVEPHGSNYELTVTVRFVRCFFCGVDITGNVPFEYEFYKFCSITCLKEHRMKKKKENEGKEK